MFPKSSFFSLSGGPPTRWPHYGGPIEQANLPQAATLLIPSIDRNQFAPPRRKAPKDHHNAPKPWTLHLPPPGGTVRPMPGRAGRSSPCILAGLNLDHFAFGEGLGAELAPGGPHPDVLNHAWRDYRNRVGAYWRLLDLFDEIHCPRRCW